MAQDPRTALQQFIAAVERHFEAVSTRRGQEDPAVEAAYFQLEDAFVAYEEALEEHYEEFLPMTQVDEEE